MFLNIAKSIKHLLIAIFWGMLTKVFWKEVLKFLFVKLFWQGLASTIIFILMIPAMRSGDIPIWLALIGSILMGVLSILFSETYYLINPFTKKKDE